MPQSCFCATPAGVDGMHALAGIISDAMRVVSITSGQATIVYDAVAVATILVTLGWTSADADALAIQHPDLPAVIIDATVEAMAEVEATRGPPSDERLG